MYEVLFNKRSLFYETNFNNFRYIYVQDNVVYN